MNDELLMCECIRYAASFSGFTKSNPLVAAALVDTHNNILSMGAHKSFGDEHAEINLIASAGDSIKGGRVFLTLEPCSTFGKTPPCVDKLIAMKVSEVVIALLDPNPKNHLHGVKKLLEAGISVKLGVAANEAAKLISPFIKTFRSDFPFITAKIAMSLDGAIATKTGASQWITSTASRNEVHRLRSKTDAILTGIGTVVRDDPMLNCRLDDQSRQPVRVVLDTDLKIPHQSNIIKSAKTIETIIFTSVDEASDRFKKIEASGVTVCHIEKDSFGKVDIKSSLKKLKSLDIVNILVEAGAKMLGSFNDQKLIDRYVFFIAPIIIGGDAAMRSIGGVGADKLDNINALSAFDLQTRGRDIMATADAVDYTEEIVTETLKIRDELCLQG